MKILKNLLLAALLISAASPGILAQKGYSDNKTILKEAEGLAASHPTLCTLRKLVLTDGGKEIIVLTIGTGDRDNKPGMAILGGIEGNYLLGRELAIGFARSVLRESEKPEIKKLLDEMTFYVFPDVSPDASEQYFSKKRYERNTNTRTTDEDKDFLIDEDPAEDLNGDGFITLLRITDPAGTYIESTEDKRIMVVADLSKGEKGAFLICTEGIDNDKDGKLNEDPDGGVSFNRNLTFNYEEFGPNAGLHPVSEPETKGVLDFLFDRFNIFATLAFGPQDNLSQQSKSADRPSAPQTSQQQERQSNQGSLQGQFQRTGERKLTTWQRGDETLLKFAGEKYREITGLKGTAPLKSAPGNFVDWSYFHYGRYSFGTPGWWFPAEKDKNQEVAFLKYTSENKLDDQFVTWTEIDHPDFPGKKTEAGGIKPFALINPPAEKLEELTEKNYRFILSLADMRPSLEIIDIKNENRGDNIFRITLKIHNKGLMATSTEAGEDNMWTRIMSLRLETEKGQSLLSGLPVQRINRIAGNGSEEFSWLVLGKGNVRITAGAVNTGFTSTTLSLK